MAFILVIFALIATAFSASYFLPWAVTKLVGIFIKPVGKYARKVGKLFFVGAVCCFVFGLAFGWRLVTVRHVDIFFDDLPEAFDGYKIAQLSDLHLGTYHFSHRTIAREVRKTLAEQPDLIVFTGDIVNFMPSELRPFTEILSGLHAPDGVWSIMGNHDYVMYNDRLTAAQRARCIMEIQDMERSMGWHLMLNENAVIRHGGDSIALIGVENQGKKYPYPQRANLSKALSGLPEGIFKILLSHDPTFWERAVLPQTDIGLTLSGHTHAWQFRLWGISPSNLMFRQWGGLYTTPTTASTTGTSSTATGSTTGTSSTATGSTTGTSSTATASSTGTSSIATAATTSSPITASATVTALAPTTTSVTTTQPIATASATTTGTTTSSTTSVVPTASSARSVNGTARKLFVSTGSGGNIPFRFGSWPEIDILTLHRSRPASRDTNQ